MDPNFISQPATALSAPGKVLLTGGYLILDRNYTGTVFALDSRIHVIVQQLRRSHKEQPQSDSSAEGTDTATPNLESELSETTVPAEQPEDKCTIVVRSPQFIDALWEYRIQRCENGGGVVVIQKDDRRRNPFVETSLSYALTYISYVADSKDFGSLSITILADNDYYSATEASNRAGTRSRGRFVDFGVPLHEAHKTGLGSSAALVSALVSALVIHRTMRPDDLDMGRGKLHNLAQTAHCAAQGKVGSGFDVAAAIYGTCLYRRFSPAILQSLGDVGSPGFEERLFAVVEDVNPDHPWDTECVDFGMSLPPGMQMVLCDVDCGSQTPSMVKKVLEWRENNWQDADYLWNMLQTNNEKLRQELKRLAGIPSGEQPIMDFSNVRDFIRTTRDYIRTMSWKSGVPIEPKVQTELLDAASEIDGVIGGVVPGAGGYDAIVLLIRDDLTVIARLNALFENWESKVEDDFGGKIGKVRLLGVRHGSEGVRNEMLKHYCGWI